MSSNDVDTSSTTSVVATSSSSQITSESIVSTSSVTDGEQFVEDSSSSSVEEVSSIIEESSSEQPIETSQVTYHVRFVNYDDSLLYETDVAEGQEATYVGSVPTRPDGDNCSYTFRGWDNSLSSITSNLTVKAVFAEIVTDEGGWSPIIRF